VRLRHTASTFVSLHPHKKSLIINVEVFSLTVPNLLARRNFVSVYVTEHASCHITAECEAEGMSLNDLLHPFTFIT
jgi:hypothetical protein